MNIAVHAVDSSIPNVALMKLSTWHKQQGHSVKLFEPLFDNPDRLYLSRLYSFSDDFRYLPPCEVIKGGTGYDMSLQLPCDDTTYPDYELYGCDYAFGRITRGCPRSCEWCVVPKTDGSKVRQVAELSNFVGGGAQFRALTRR